MRNLISGSILNLNREYLDFTRFNKLRYGNNFLPTYHSYAALQNKVPV